MKLAEGEERGQVVEEQKTQPKLASFVMDEVMAVDEVQEDQLHPSSVTE
ncbi:MAG: hypothetical protein U0892_13420 [Pirellulales bacterium]